jgi:hypothetical protein
MSTKFEQLLDYLVNEDHEKANELFHEIVVEKSREIYENLIAEEDQDMEEARDEDMEEAADEDMEEAADEDMEEAFDADMDESEDSYMMDSDETGDETDDFGGDISADGDNFDAPKDDEHDHEDQEDSAIMDIKNAIAELEAAFAELEQAQGKEEDEMDMDSDDEMDMDDGEDADEDMMGMMENRRMTREYVEKVGHDWDKNAQKGPKGEPVGAGSGDFSRDGETNPKSVVRSGKGKPTTGATAKNIGQGGDEGQSNTGTSPGKVNRGIQPESGDKFAKEAGNVPGGKMGVKNLKKVGDYSKGEQTSPKGLNVGARTGDNENQGERNTRSVVDRKIG